MAGRLYSVGKEIISMDWVELSLTVLSKTRDSALAEVIITVIIINVNVPITRAVSASALAVTQTPGPEVTPASSSSLATFTAFPKTGNLIMGIITISINVIIRWTKFTKPEPAFNMFSLGNIPLILGIASLDPGHQVLTIVIVIMMMMMMMMMIM